jgi:hypothetical protein
MQGMRRLYVLRRVQALYDLLAHSTAVPELLLCSSQDLRDEGEHLMEIMRSYPRFENDDLVRFRDYDTIYEVAFILSQTDDTVSWTRVSQDGRARSHGLDHKEGWYRVGRVNRRRVWMESPAVNSLLVTAAELLQGGAHPGPCTNIENPSEPCTQHLIQHEIREAAVRRAIDEVKKAYP